MDTSNPSAFVNAQLLPSFIGKKVRAVVQVNRSDGEITTAKSTDESQLTIKGLPPQVPLMNYVEVVGIAESINCIRAEIWTDFGASFGTLKVAGSATGWYGVAAFVLKNQHTA